MSRIDLRRLLPVALVAAALVGSGCGEQGRKSGASQEDPGTQGGGGGGANDLSASDAADVLEAKRTINEACGGSDVPSVKPAGEDVTSAARVIALATSQYPDKVYEPGTED